LAVIEGNGGPIPVGEVGAHMHITSGTMTSVLDTLERNDYVKRLADPHDRRRVLVDVTPKAQVVLDKMLPEVQQICAVTLAGLNDTELERLLDALAVVRNAIAAAPDDTGPPPARRTPPASDVPEKRILGVGTTLPTVTPSGLRRLPLDNPG
jgi:DNA-binding MarR family transcriptional regulator